VRPLFRLNDAIFRIDLQYRQVCRSALEAASELDCNGICLQRLAWPLATLDHFVMVRIHARQPSSPRADLRAIEDPKNKKPKTAVIWLLSGFAVLLAKGLYVAILESRELP
jgi:hypothetical protein